MAARKIRAAFAYAECKLPVMWGLTIEQSSLWLADFGLLSMFNRP